MYPLIHISLAKTLYDKRERDIVSCQKMEEGTDADGGNDFRMNGITSSRLKKCLSYFGGQNRVSIEE